jgi:hypothetical protein
VRLDLYTYLKSGNIKHVRQPIIQAPISLLLKGSIIQDILLVAYLICVMD